MDSLRRSFSATDGDMAQRGDAAQPADAPAAIGRNERRMQVRAYNHWAGLLDDRNCPAITDFSPDALPDFAPFGVLLDFSAGEDNPAIAYLGAALAQECGVEAPTIRTWADVPECSLLSRVSDHYPQTLASQTPIGFEAEFVNRNGRTVLYRGILLPFSSDDTTIDFVYGVINWKEAAAPPAAALSAVPATLLTAAPLASWADGPAASAMAQPAIAPDDRTDPVPMGLADLLSTAREMAQAAHDNDERTHWPLYAAIGQAYDFLLAARGAPDDLAEMVTDAGLTMQIRAPTTPVVKLVFGADYDKTRLTEYAAALNHATRLGLPHGALAQFLRDHDGGLKGVVKAERALRREDGDDQAPSREGRGSQLAGQLRALPVRGFDTIEKEGSEFALVLIRRGEDGQIAVVGEVPEDATLVRRAARHLLR